MVHILLATGDLAMDREDYNESFVVTRDMLQGADITFCQLETSFAEKGVGLPQARRSVHGRLILDLDGAAPPRGFTQLLVEIESITGTCWSAQDVKRWSKHSTGKQTWIWARIWTLLAKPHAYRQIRQHSAGLNR